jgi:hypothetical protein
MAQSAVNDLESGCKTICDKDSLINSFRCVGKWLRDYSKVWESLMLEDGSPVSTGPSVLIASTTSGFHWRCLKWRGKERGCEVVHETQSWQEYLFVVLLASKTR